jgi:drug/metabolite transporter (DMT)-like permease
VNLNKKFSTIFLAVFACLLWASVYPIIKIGLQYAPPLHFAGIRFIIAGVVILPFTVSPASYITMLRENFKLVISVTALQTLLNYSLFYSGMKLVPGAIGAVIVGSQPLITAIVSAIMIKEEKLNLKKIITIAVGITGVLLISAGRQAFKLGQASELLGVAMILSANLATAVSNVLISAGNRKINPFVLSSFSLFTGGILITGMSLIVEEQPGFDLPASYWGSLAWLSMVAAVAFSIWYKLLQRPGVRVSELNLWKFIIPGLGAILSWAILPDENPEWLTISGVVVITVSLIMFFRSNRSENEQA